MDKRLETRISTSGTVAITLLGATDIQFPARVRNVTARGMGLQLERAVAAGTAVKIEVDDALLLGEVVYCRAFGSWFSVGVELEQELTGLANLKRMVNALADESRSSPLDSTVSDIRIGIAR